MTAHKLAKILLEKEDLPVLVTVPGYYGDFSWEEVEAVRTVIYGMNHPSIVLASNPRDISDGAKI